MRDATHLMIYRLYEGIGRHKSKPTLKSHCKNLRVSARIKMLNTIGILGNSHFLPRIYTQIFVLSIYILDAFLITDI